MHQLLKTLVDQGGTDLHITTNTPPQVRIDGKMVPLQLPPLTAPETKQLVYSVLTDNQKHRFEETLELDFSFGVRGLARFRANVYFQRGAVAGAFRTIPWEIRSFKDLGLPEVDKPRGLFSSPARPGPKSTTLAASSTRSTATAASMVTIEDPIRPARPQNA
jgi:twitching motility protein PilT